MARSKAGRKAAGGRCSWEKQFLRFIETGETVQDAADKAGIHSSTAYARRKANPSFREDWENAKLNSGRTVTDRKPQWRGTFLDALAQTSNVSKSAAKAVTPLSTVYKERRENRDFARRWAEALAEGYAHLELETLERLRNGVPTDGNKFDIANALRLLTLHKDAVAKERARHTMKDEDEILLGIERKIDRLRAREREGQKLLADLSRDETVEAPHA